MGQDWKFTVVFKSDRKENDLVFFPITQKWITVDTWHFHQMLKILFSVHDNNFFKYLSPFELFISIRYLFFDIY